MGESYREALVRGVPFPILKVAEYFSLGEEGFTWGGQYRAAGYYGSIFLWSVRHLSVEYEELCVFFYKYLQTWK